MARANCYVLWCTVDPDEFEKRINAAPVLGVMLRSAYSTYPELHDFRYSGNKIGTDYSGWLVKVGESINCICKGHAVIVFGAQSARRLLGPAALAGAEIIDVAPGRVHPASQLASLSDAMARLCPVLHTFGRPSPCDSIMLLHAATVLRNFRHSRNKAFLETLAGIRGTGGPSALWRKFDQKYFNIREHYATIIEFDTMSPELAGIVGSIANEVDREFNTAAKIRAAAWNGLDLIALSIGLVAPENKVEHVRPPPFALVDLKIALPSAKNAEVPDALALFCMCGYAIDKRRQRVLRRDAPKSDGTRTNSLDIWVWAELYYWLARISSQYAANIAKNKQ